ncbi:MAG: aldo/keto reductase [Bacteroidota bacterium]
METIKISENLEMSRIVQGFWRLKNWDMNNQELLRFVEEALDIGVTTFDHADVYGDYMCEALFGQIFRLKPGLRKRMQLVTKCGIKMMSDKFPERMIKHYDTGYEHIIFSVEQSLKNLHTDHIDLLLIHRPDPLMDPAETAKAFEELESQGKVLNFGVSNFTPMQFEMLDRHFDGPLVTNQVEISPYNLEHFQNGNIEFFLREGIHPMAWSPLSGGKIFEPGDEKGIRIKTKLKEIAKTLGVEAIEKVIYAWLLAHPAGIIPIVGTGRIERLKKAVQSLNIELTREQWFDIYVASMGHKVP